MPTRFSPSTTGTPEMFFARVSSMTSRIVASGVTVIGSWMTPLSNFLTCWTWRAWSFGDMFLWMMPMPPSCASVIASRASVTVSIAAEMIGMFSVRERVSCVFSFTSRGKTSE